jgi:type III secretion protein J
VSEVEANEMIALLMERGILATKSAGTEKTWDVSVKMEDFPNSVEILNSFGYPREDYYGVGQAFKKSGLVSSPTEERIRFMYSLSQDIAATISLIDGVTDAQVHIVLPDNDPFSDNFYPASAAVFINYRPDSNVEASVSKIKNLVMNSVEGLSYDNISVALFPKNVVEAASLQRATQLKSISASSIVWIVVLVALILGGCAGGFFWYTMHRNKDDKEPPQTGKGTVS